MVNGQYDEIGMTQTMHAQKTEPIDCPETTHSSARGLPLHSLGQHVDALVDTVSRGVDKEAESYNLTHLQFALIRMFLVDLERTVTELAQMFSMDLPGMSRVVSRLADRGLLSRRRPRENRRVVLLQLTEEGVALGLELHERAHAYEERLTQGIDADEQESFLATIRKIVANHAALERSRPDSGGAG